MATCHNRELSNLHLPGLQLGGRRIDSGDSYDNVRVIGTAIKASGVDRKDIFLVR